MDQDITNVIIDLSSAMPMFALVLISSLMFGIFELIKSYIMDKLLFVVSTYWKAQLNRGLGLKGTRL